MAFLPLGSDWERYRGVSGDHLLREMMAWQGEGLEYSPSLTLGTVGGLWMGASLWQMGV